MKAQLAQDIDVRGITGLRQGKASASREEVEGLTFYRTSGDAAGPTGMREWREVNALAGRVARVIAEWRPDILHAHSPALGGMAGLKASRAHGIPLVYEIRAFWEDAAVGNGTSSEGSVRYWLTRELENEVIAGADAVMTICHGLRQDLIARGFASEKIGVMPNGVDLSLFGTPPSRDEALARELGFADAGPVIGFIGSFYDYEGLDDLIAAMPLVLQTCPDARLLLVGGGPVEDALRRRAEASSAAYAIRFCGRVPHAEVERYYSLCEIMAYPRKASRLTDLVTPLKPLEAMAQGKLVAASDVGGHRELMADGITGSLFASDDPRACAAAIAKLAAARDRWPPIREAARAHVAKEHDWAKNVRRYQDVYQGLLSHSSAGRSSVAA